VLFIPLICDTTQNRFNDKGREHSLRSNKEIVLK